MRIKSNLSEDEFQELSRPKLKLFMSVDIVGSTHFKQRESKDRNQNWLNLFINFFQEFPDLLNTEITGLDSKLPLLRLWKALGDELIFTVELKHRKSAVQYIKALSRTMRKKVRIWHANSDATLKTLDLKGAAWLVGFPVGNAEIPLISSAGKDEENSGGTRSDDRDYIGPLVDTGFRVKEYASSRKLALSADLAYLMLVNDWDETTMQLFFEGEIPLKGVLQGKPYPIIWLDCHGHPEAEHIASSAEMNRLRDTFTGKTPAAPASLQTFLKHWLQGTQNLLCIPFIYEDLCDDFPPSPDFEKCLEASRVELRKNFYHESPADEDKAGENTMPQKVSTMIANILSDPLLSKAVKTAE
ncbi:hypothetical protein [Prosthecobacter dejongeii]|uniref:Uncharacterized protein n=1 Tax=Prosthecobacter dejongeii TaxID=48465 RepID=A0A7W8DQU3_9BACT|nr:hypothetical protein [Prosthecobacter dejongeii]MBB5038717.1 hypothetical protein [Prosthecobacter dejongeii]